MNACFGDSLNFAWSPVSMKPFFGDSPNSPKCTCYNCYHNCYYALYIIRLGESRRAICMEFGEYETL